jgi:hypothetical protein
MNNKMRNLTLSAAALAALMVVAPKASAQAWSRGRGSESPRRELRGHERRDFRGQEFRGHEREEFRGREFRGNAFRGRSFSRPAAAFYGRGYVSPFRVFAGSRFYSYRPGPGYFFVGDLGWVFPPFPGAVWVPAHYDYDSVWVEGCWR